MPVTLRREKESPERRGLMTTAPAITTMQVAPRATVPNHGAGVRIARAAPTRTAIGIGTSKEPLTFDSREMVVRAMPILGIGAGPSAIPNGGSREVSRRDATPKRAGAITRRPKKFAPVKTSATPVRES